MPDIAYQLPRQMVEAALARHPEALVAATLGLWRQLALELIPIIGDEGFKAIYVRSLRMASTQFLGLKQVVAPVSGGDAFEPLRQLLETRDLEQATKASIGFFMIFFDTLTSLIGEGLTTHLLHTAWGQRFSEITETSKTDFLR